jgi:hypothetical protein
MLSNWMWKTSFKNNAYIVLELIGKSVSNQPSQWDQTPMLMSGPFPSYQ